MKMLILLNVVLIILLLTSFQETPKLGGVIYTEQNGIFTYPYKIPLKTATTTPCAIQSPKATSTIIHASFSIGTGTSTANFVEIGKATTAFATTTSLGYLTIASGKSGTLVSTTTSQNDNLIIAPSNWVVTKMSQSYDQVPPGVCEVIFRTVN
jgi:hypothetical protein